VRYLLDTHALLWFVAGDEQLSSPARAAIADERNEILVSAASAWEIATKFRIGKLPGASLLANNFVATVTGLGFSHLSITANAAQRAGSWEIDHNDPFDRMLAAQSLLERSPLISNDRGLTRFGISLFW